MNVESSNDKFGAHLSAEPDPFRYDDGAYLLGALSAQERTAFEQHLTGCAECRSRLAEIEQVPILLAAVDPGDVAAAGLPAMQVEQPPDTLWPGLLRRAAAERRRRQRLMTALGAVAAACVLALALVLWPHTTSSGHPVPRALVAVMRSPVQADATLVAKTWGTQIELHCRYSGGGDRDLPYLLVVHDQHGRPEKLGTWTLPPGGDIRFSAGTALRPAQISRIDVALLNGTPILSLRT